jgi:hypothetical protein
MPAAYDHACFISYTRSGKEARSSDYFHGEFAKAFERMLRKFLGSAPEPYRDDQLRPGEHYPTHLWQRLCRSACLVAIIVPEYFDHEWCRNEWQTMERLERQRLGKGRKELIIPILLRGDRATEERCGERQFENFRHLYGPRQLDNVSYRKQVDRIADEIKRICRQPAQPWDCEKAMNDVGAPVEPSGGGAPNPMEH